ncbi:MAG: hypothetical protein FWD78_02955 [Treponema sp.]|nr:hypothetical protein [Treponema sp.]
MKENTPTVRFESGLVLIRQCPHCGRFIKIDDQIWENDVTGLKDAPNATCKKCGRVKAYDLGYF